MNILAKTGIDADSAIILGTVFVGIFGTFIFLSFLQLRRRNLGHLLPSLRNPSKNDYEIFCLIYSFVWISIFGVIISFSLYEKFDEKWYMIVCGSLAMPLLLQPILFPFKSDRNKSIVESYSFKANVWIFIFSFIGNYWYTHYFYSVLKANYTFPSWRINNVPIPLIFATHFYFSTYHTLSNMLLRYIDSSYLSMGRSKFWFKVFAVLSFAYFTAFMETVTISGFPYYSFENRSQAYTLGSAFYGIYFIVSFPMFYRIEEVDYDAAAVKDAISKTSFTIGQVIFDAFAAGMIVMCLLDFVRLYVGVPFEMK